MAKANTAFELSIEDLDVIERALRIKKRDLSRKRLEVMRVKAAPNTEESKLTGLEDTLRTVHDLLGRLHNQKNFFRPADTPYVGG